MKENRLSGLLGHPLGHSVSPFIHEYLGRNLGINVKYDKYDIEENEIDSSLARFSAEEFAGLNVTIPYKNIIMEKMTRVDAAATKLGAVNTVVIKDGSFEGFNTDYLGLKRELEYFGVEIINRNVVILGAGGASRAVKYMCELFGASKVRQFNRTPGKDGSESFEEACKLTANDKQVVIQTTSVGMYPNVTQTCITDEAFYDGIGVGIDIIYNPLETCFMKMVKSHGGRAYNGLRMLLYQAVESFKLFHNIKDVPFEVEEGCYRNLLLNMNQSIVFCGMMGSGKSTLGRILAEEGGALFVDTDEFIEKAEGMSINDIFETKGEEAFRKMEHEALGQLLVKYRNSEKKVVYSLGGGMCNPMNIDLIRRLGYVCYINCDVDTLCDRLGNDTSRPLLKNTDLRNKIETLLKERHELYMEASDEVINN